MRRKPSKERPVLIKDQKYQGKYVAFEGFNKRKIIASGDNPSKVIREAKRKGAESPVLFFVEEEGTTYLY